MTISVWDFGGQGEYYSSHEVFLNADNGMFTVTCNLLNADRENRFEQVDFHRVPVHASVVASGVFFFLMCVHRLFSFVFGCGSSKQCMIVVVEISVMKNPLCLLWAPMPMPSMIYQWRKPGPKYVNLDMRSAHGVFEKSYTIASCDLMTTGRFA